MEWAKQLGRAWGAALAVLWLLWGSASVASASEEWRWEFDPDDQPYPPYVADPRRPRMQVAFGTSDSDIDATSRGRVLLDTGARYTLFRAVDPVGNEWSIDIEAGLFSQFDLGNSLDSIGWDGVYGVFGVYEWHDTLDIRIGYKHLSAHLGDEYIETTGRQRVGYTREAAVVGMAWTLDERWIGYVEPSWAVELGNRQRQERPALEAGVQYQGPFSGWGGKAAFYGGLHLRAFKESDWQPDLSLQLGYLIKRDASSTDLRLMLELYSGRAILGEFALDEDETYLIVGAVFDFY